MNNKNIGAIAQVLAKKIDAFVSKDMPTLAGNIAESHINNNFRQGGFTNNGVKQWPVTKRQQRGSPYGPLLSQHNHLMSNIEKFKGDARVKIVNATPYAKIHNEGGEINVTPRMRKFAWWKYYDSGGRKKGEAPRKVPEDAEVWKRLALTKKTTLRIPQRQFMGQSAEMNKEIYARLEKGISDILKQ